MFGGWHQLWGTGRGCGEKKVRDSQANGSAETIGRDVILGVFGDVDVDEVARPVQQVSALAAQVRQVKSLATGFVLLGQHVDRFQTGLIVDACVVEIDHDIVGITRRLEQLFKG